MVFSMKIGFIGLGRMGKNIVLNLLEHDIEVVAWNRSPEPREELKKEASALKSGSDKLTIVEVDRLNSLRILPKVSPKLISLTVILNKSSKLGLALSNSLISLSLKTKKPVATNKMTTRI